MALTTEDKIALANDVRRQTTSLQVEGLKGQMTSLGTAAQIIGSLSQDVGRQLAIVTQDLAALSIGAGMGLTDDFGKYSSIDRLLRTERFAGKNASVDFVKLNPECTETEATDAWEAASVIATGLPVVVVPAVSYGKLYRANLLAAGMVPDTTWESQRAWIVATDKAVIMGA